MKKPIEITEYHVLKGLAFIIVSGFPFGVWNYCIQHYRAAAIWFGLVAAIPFLSHALSMIAHFLANKKNK
jgi:hypothetical protein